MDNSPCKKMKCQSKARWIYCKSFLTFDWWYNIMKKWHLMVRVKLSAWACYEVFGAGMCMSWVRQGTRQKDTRVCKTAQEVLNVRVSYHRWDLCGYPVGMIQCLTAQTTMKYECRTIFLTAIFADLHTTARGQEYVKLAWFFDRN